MINEKVIICGICKDIEKRLPFSINIVEKIGLMFEDYKVFIYENNSTDDTKKIIIDWNLKNSKINYELEDIDDKNLYINEDYLKSSGTSRARNKILDKISSISDEYKYVIWIDMDFIKEPNYEGFIEIFESKKEWDAVFANGIDPNYGYWDWLAFRDYKNPFGPELLGHHEWYQKKEDLGLKYDDDWYPVISAFGGCGIYKRQAIKGCRYSAEVTSDMQEVVRLFIKNNPNHPEVIKYKSIVSNTKEIYYIVKREKGLPKIMNYEAGIYLSDDPDKIMWRMSSFTWQYPCICDHMGIHYSMIKNGYNKLYINPRLIFRYGD